MAHAHYDSLSRCQPIVSHWTSDGQLRTYTPGSNCGSTLEAILRTNAVGVRPKAP